MRGREFFINYVPGEDNEIPDPDDVRLSTFLQWKGTDVCIDLHCECGHHFHYDGMFLYFWRCKSCGQVWELPCYIPMRKVAKLDSEINAVQEG